MDPESVFRNSEYRLPHSAEMAALTLSQDFVNLTEKIKRDLNITILPWVDRSGAGEETIIRFCLNRSNVDFLATSRDLVEEYLVQRKVSSSYTFLQYSRRAFP
jgi:hypothetical protein